MVISTRRFLVQLRKFKSNFKTVGIVQDLCFFNLEVKPCRFLKLVTTKKKRTLQQFKRLLINHSNDQTKELIQLP